MSTSLRMLAALGLFLTPNLTKYNDELDLLDELPTEPVKKKFVGKYPKGWGLKKRQALDKAIQNGMSKEEAIEYVSNYSMRNESSN